MGGKIDRRNFNKILNKKINKGRQEEGIKKERRTERKKEFRGKGGKKSLLLALNRSGQLCWSFCL